VRDPRFDAGVQFSGGNGSGSPAVAKPAQASSKVAHIRFVQTAVNRLLAPANGWPQATRKLKPKEWRLLACREDRRLARVQF
jgi:hypothetical protein